MGKIQKGIDFNVKYNKIIIQKLYFMYIEIIVICIYEKISYRKYI